MKRCLLSLSAALASFVTPISSAVYKSHSAVTTINEVANVKYVGFMRNGLEVFLNIPYAQDTSGGNRFKPPRPIELDPGTIINATSEGPACPQALGQWNVPLTLNNITSVSEDCLNLNIVRPNATVRENFSKKQGNDKGLPVMVWIHGGSFWVGSNTEPTHQPDGLVIQSVENALPVIVVAMNYRLGLFGFAQSDALKAETSLNAGLRDQRLSIEWVRDHISWFGGDPNNITIFGQSSGGLAVGLQLLAYGGTKQLPYQRGICESQALEPGITGNFTIDATSRVIDYVGCNSSSIHSADTIACLRAFDTQTLLNASLATYVGDIAHNIGDVWLPTVDGDFLPDVPSKLVSEGRFGGAAYMIGWTDGDVNFFTDPSIASADATFEFIQSYLPSTPSTAIARLLDLYPVSDFKPPPNTNLTADFFRTARIFRDIIMTCQPMFLAEAIHAKGAPVYLYDFNQTILEPIIEDIYNISHIGVVHTSEFAYTFGNLSHWNISGFPFNPTSADFDLLKRASRSWSTFASLGVPSTIGDGLKNWEQAYVSPNNTNVFVIGGPNQGLSAIDGQNSIPQIRAQRLRERCALINSEEFIKYLQY